jgi:hypothetical protein
MKKEKDPPKRASEVLNWDYLVEIAEKAQGKRKTLDAVLKDFAYDFTSTADEDRRDEMLKNILKNATENTSRMAAEEFIKNAAIRFHCERKLLREFAKEAGIRLLPVLPGWML